MKLAELLSEFCPVTADADLSGLALDSRRLQAGAGFIALNGSQQHGLQHARQAVAQGASAIIYDPVRADLHDVAALQIPAIAVADLDQKLGEMAARFYAYPSRKLDVIGITGTNGKTTCSQLIAQALPDCGVIGTLGWGDIEHLQATANTTPDALSAQQILAELVRLNKKAVAMEVSSHGLHQGRVNGIRFKGAVFTNLSRDHLDYHGDMASYLQAKLGLFRMPDLQFAVLNIDDPHAKQIISTLGDNVQPWFYSASGNDAGDHCLAATNIQHSADGMAFDAVYRGQTLRATTTIAGAFNLENLLAVACVLLAMGWSFADTIKKLATLKPITGRMERFGGQGKPTVFVDYAHSPDALEKALKSIHSAGRLRLVFGCGGDRDKGKRPQMGRIAETLADLVIVTDDNPRHEAATAIVNDILSGCSSQKITVIHDRAAAIQTAIQQAQAEDCVLVAGKGHEDYQEIAGVKWPFRDQDAVKSALATWSLPCA